MNGASPIHGLQVLSRGHPRFSQGCNTGMLPGKGSHTTSLFLFHFTPRSAQDPHGDTHRKAEREEIELLLFRSDFSQCNLAGRACICERTEEVEMQWGLRNCPFSCCFFPASSPKPPMGLSPHQSLPPHPGVWLRVGQTPRAVPYYLHLLTHGDWGTLQMEPPFLLRASVAKNSAKTHTTGPATKQPSGKLSVTINMAT